MKKPRDSDRILDAFEALWGCEKRFPELFPFFEEPLDDLILTVLSQNTNDRNRDKAFEKLRGGYPAWEDVAALPEEEIEDCIRPAGLSKTKAGRIKTILVTVKKDFGDYSIKAMRDWDAEKIRSYLTALPGVGAKTAGIVLVFDLGKPAFPVDTHIARISRRLGWADEKTPPDKIQAYLESALPPERFGGAHLNMITHGRNICGARKPKCAACPAAPCCRFGRAELAGARRA